MRNIQKNLLAVMVLSFFTHCKNKEQANESALLSINERQHALVEWEKFKSTSDSSIIATQDRINLLWAKNNSATPKKQVQIRRVVNKTQYQLEKLQKKLYDRDKWFINNSGTYTQGKANETQAFEMAFKKKMNIINIEIDNCKT